VDMPRTSKNTPKRIPSNARDYAKEEKMPSPLLVSRAAGTRSFCNLIVHPLRSLHQRRAITRLMMEIQAHCRVVQTIGPGHPP
jgi:hypothetical protein